MDSNSVIFVHENTDMVTTILTQGVDALLTGVFVLLAACIAYKSGMKAYFTRREHEQIIKRYLDEGVDLVLGSVKQVLVVFLDNNLNAETILGQLQKNEETDLSVKFERFKRHILEFTPQLKITRLVGDNTVEELIGGLFGFIDGHTVFLNTTFLPTLKEANTIRTSRKDLLDVLKEMQNELDVFKQQFDKYFLLVDVLHQITSILERQTTFNWSNLDQFKNRPEIRASVERLKEIFKAELQETLGQKQ